MSPLMVRSEASGRYIPATNDEIIRAAASLQLRQLVGKAALESPRESARFICKALRGRQAEVFCMLTLDNRHRVLRWHELFQGTIDSAMVHPRELVKQALADNAAAVILAHNHPSGAASPSVADELITQRLKDALGLVEIRVLDHLIVGSKTHTSLAERGLI